MDVFLDDLGLGLAGLALLEHAGTHRADLGTVIRAQDGGHQVAAESGTGPRHVAALRVDVQAGAVGRQAGLQAAGHPGAQIPTVVGGANEHACGAVLLHQGAQSDGVGVGGVVFIFRAVHYDYLVCSMLRGSGYSRVRVMTDDHSGQSSALFGRHGLSGGEQFQTHVFGSAIPIGLYKYPKLFRFGFHCASLP